MFNIKLFIKLIKINKAKSNLVVQEMKIASS